MNERVKSIKENPWPVIKYITVSVILSVIIGTLVLHITGIIFFLGALYYLKISIWEVSNEENALKKTLKTIVKNKVYSDGLFIFWAYIDSIKRFPTEVQKIDLKAQKVMTRDDPENKIYMAEVEVDTVISYYLPTTYEGLEALLVKAPDPESLKALFSEFIMGAIRAVLNTYTWKDLPADKKELSKMVEAILAESDNPITGSKVEKFSVIISDVRIPQSLKDAIQSRQNSVFEADAIGNLAEAESNKSRKLGKAAADNARALGEANAASSQREIEAFSTDPVAAQKVMYTKMAAGASSTIFAVLPESLHEAIETSNELRSQRASGNIKDDDDEFDAILNVFPEEIREQLKYLPDEAFRALFKKMAPRQLEKFAKKIGRK